MEEVLNAQVALDGKQRATVTLDESGVMQWRDEQFDTDAALELWCDAIQRILDDSGRPKRFLVLVNPFGGDGAGKRVYTTVVESLLKAAGITFTMQEVEGVVLAVLQTGLGSKDAISDASLPEGILQAFHQSASFTEAVNGESEASMSLEDFRKWCASVPSIKKFLSTLLKGPVAGLPGRLVPELLIPEKISQYQTVMRKEYAWHLAGAMQPQEAVQWVLVYHNSAHGLSFNTFLGKLAIVQGPSVLVMKDKEGCVYGGYASQPWVKHSDFYGDMKSFLFSLHPKAAVYRPTGKNTNLQWVKMNIFQLRYVAALALIVTVMTSSASAAQTVHRYEWEISYSKFSPDCNATGSKDVLGVHQISPEDIPLQTFPGPTVRAREGDRIEVKVTNKISKYNAFGVPAERVAIHWHGIIQKGSPGSDGAAGLTECGIPHNNSKVYNFTADKAGTYFWHGHYGPQRTAGLYGLLIIDQRAGALVPTYDGEFAITVSDWWHADIYNQTHGLDTSQNWTYVGNPQSFLIKGDPSLAPCLSDYSCPSAELQCNTHKLSSTITGAGTLIWNVLPNKTYLVRMASTTSSAFLNFVIEGHVMTVLEADGHRIQPFDTTSIDILSGQTYTFTFTTKPEYPEHQRVYHVGVNARDQLVDSRPNGTDPGLAVLSYNVPHINQTTVTPSPTNASLLWQDEPQIQLGGPRYNDKAFGPYFASQVKAEIGYSYPVPRAGTVNISFLISQIRVQDPVPEKNRFQMRWAVNNVSYDTSNGNTYLLKRIFDKDPGLKSISDSRYLKPLDLSLSDITEMRTYNRSLNAIQGGYYKLETGDIVTVILQNAAMYNLTTSEAHPWHLHGHDFWVLGYGDGLYDPDTSPAGFNLDNPPVRNTVPVFGLGWVAIRFIADNPGVWSFHCHNEWHMHLGMMVVFAYGVPSINPGQIAQCN